jgi:hypothetical protein
MLSGKCSYGKRIVIILAESREAVLNKFPALNGSAASNLGDGHVEIGPYSPQHDFIFIFRTRTANTDTARLMARVSARFATEDAEDMVVSAKQTILVKSGKATALLSPQAEVAYVIYSVLMIICVLRVLFQVQTDKAGCSAMDSTLYHSL